MFVYQSAEVSHAKCLSFFITMKQELAPYTLQAQVAKTSQGLSLGLSG